jgi:hypothetical protein
MIESDGPDRRLPRPCRSGRGEGCLQGRATASSQRTLTSCGFAVKGMARWRRIAL